GNEHLCALKAVPRTLQHERHALHIVAPIAQRLRPVKIKGAALIQIAGVHLDSAALCSTHRYPTIEIDSSGHDKAIVVVSMLSDQVDASGCAVEKAVLSVTISETASNIHRPSNSAGGCAGRNRSDAANHQILPSHVLDNFL